VGLTNNFKFKNTNDSNGSSLDRLMAEDPKDKEKNILDDLELFIHEKADLALYNETFEDK
jgi:hypothetical protein